MKVTESIFFEVFIHIFTGRRVSVSIAFERIEDQLLLILTPESIDIKVILEKLKKGEEWHISRTFKVNITHLRFEDSGLNELQFCVGRVFDEYTIIDRDVIGIEHDFYFCNSIKLDKRHFVAFRNISILVKIDRVVESDVYIGGSYPNGCIPIETFELLIKKFPKTAELNYYANSRISTIVKEFFPHTDLYEEKFDKFIEKQERSLSFSLEPNVQSIFKENAQIEYRQFWGVREKLLELLSRSDTVREEMWQEQIHGILRLLYPKYISGVREVVIKGVDRHDKRPDFLLIDANGYVDILEIKKPSVQILTKQSSYRNNYVPVRDLAGAIQQIEKYIYCLGVWGKDGERELQKQLSGKLPSNVIPKVVNPQGLLLLGRSDQFNQQQKNDFELIKRQYKHIADIMTYDDLIQRIDNILATLKMEIRGK